MIGATISRSPGGRQGMSGVQLMTVLTAECSKEGQTQAADIARCQNSAEAVQVVARQHEDKVLPQRSNGHLA